MLCIHRMNYSSALARTFSTPNLPQNRRPLPVSQQRWQRYAEMQGRGVCSVHRINLCMLKAVWDMWWQKNRKSPYH